MYASRSIFEPTQNAKFVLFTNRSKYRKELNFFKEDVPEREPRKRVKKEWGTVWML
jgi:hypothetical protein